VSATYPNSGYLDDAHNQSGRVAGLTLKAEAFMGWRQKPWTALQPRVAYPPASSPDEHAREQATAERHEVLLTIETMGGHARNDEGAAEYSATAIGMGGDEQACPDGRHGR
jgi:hypothetical protein